VAQVLREEAALIDQTTGLLGRGAGGTGK
jgi:hypothetical protein